MARGGKRNAAGRPKGISTKILDRQSTAADMCEVLGGDAGWKEIYELAQKKKDYRTMLEIKKYWTDKRDGRAPQSVSLNHSPVQIINKRDYPETPLVQVPEKPAL